jgi:hypothetical protein
MMSAAACRALRQAGLTSAVVSPDHGSAGMVPVIWVSSSSAVCCWSCVTGAFVPPPVAAAAALSHQ